ncbi:MAG: dihydroorotate dehydrogenase-like protein [Burkholderiales bacterium]
MDLSSRYLGLTLKHPVVASASPLTATLDGMRRLEDAGAAAVVMSSVYEEQIRAEDTAYALYTEHGSHSHPETSSYFPELPDYEHGLSGRLETLRRASEALDIPVIASLNGASPEGWIEYAARLEQAGAAALELNVWFVPTDPAETGAEVERRYLQIVHAVRKAVRIPLAVKLSPYFSAPANMARALVAAGADGLVLFNRFYEPDVDLETLAPRRDLELSSRYEIRLPMMWIALLRGRVTASLAATRGVEGPEEVVKYLLAGADAVMTTSALLRRGPQHLQALVAGLEQWLQAHGHASADAVRGVLSAARADAAAEMLRSQYMRLLSEYVPSRLAL